MDLPCVADVLERVFVQQQQIRDGSDPDPPEVGPEAQRVGCIPRGGEERLPG